MDDLGWYAVGLVAFLIGRQQWRYCAQGRFLRTSPLLSATGAAYLLWQHGGYLAQSTWELRVVAGALLFLASSPLLGAWWYGWDGQLRRSTVRVFLFSILLLVVIGLLLTNVFPWRALHQDSLLRIILLAIVLAGLPFVPWQRRRRNLLARWRNWRQRQTQRQVERRQRQQDVLEHKRWRDRAQLAERRARKLAEQYARLQRQEDRRDRQRQRRRQEAIAQIRQIRAWETERLRSGEQGLRYHPSEYGFVMAEAGRVLRAEIAAGERIPAIEHETFFFEVVERLLADDEFQERYLHRAGATAITTVNEYLRAERSLASALERIHSLNLTPARLAPQTVPDQLIPGVVEAWLVPHRRYQERMRQLCLEDRHPRQNYLREFFRRNPIDLQDPQQWQTSWDDSPAVFVHGEYRQPTSTPSAPDSSRASSIWHPLKAFWSTLWKSVAPKSG